MQTFFPYPDIEKSLYCLDWKRCGKQRVESKQIIDVLEDRSNGWRYHPAVKMWRGCVDFLKVYYDWNLYVWKDKWKYRNIKLTPFRPLMLRHQYLHLKLPTWFGNEDFHSRHRAALLYKDFNYYKQFGWTEEPKIDYIWPTGG